VCAKLEELFSGGSTPKMQGVSPAWSKHTDLAWEEKEERSALEDLVSRNVGGWAEKKKVGLLKVFWSFTRLPGQGLEPSTLEPASQRLQNPSRKKIIIAIETTRTSNTITMMIIIRRRRRRRRIIIETVVGMGQPGHWRLRALGQTDGFGGRSSVLDLPSVASRSGPIGPKMLPATSRGHTARSHARTERGPASRLSLAGWRR
jgi:hypothetical protein